MPGHEADPLTVGEAAPANRLEAAELLLSDWPAAARDAELSSLVAAAGQPPHRLLEARRGGRLSGATFVRFQPGATAFVWTPRTRPPQDEAAATALLRAAADYALGAGASMVQGLTEVTAAEGTSFAAASFEHASDLVYLLAAGPQLPAALPEGDLVFEPYSASQRQRLAAIVEATYQGTLDCPALSGRRSLDDVLAGYQGTGVFHPRRWFFVRHAGRDVGCLLLADHPHPSDAAQSQMELVYMGLVPQARGRGWGRAIARYAQWVARQAGRQRLLLAVDAANSPALEGYAAVGFAALATRAVWLRFAAPAIARP